MEIQFLTDLDECDLARDDCDVNAFCVNTFGGFNCSCDFGYSGSGRECSEFGVLVLQLGLQV